MMVDAYSKDKRKVQR